MTVTVMAAIEQQKKQHRATAKVVFQMQLIAGLKSAQRFHLTCYSLRHFHNYLEFQFRFFLQFHNILYGSRRVTLLLSTQYIHNLIKVGKSHAKK